MARPKVYEERVTTTLRLPKEQHDALSRIAAANGWSTNRLVLAVLDGWVHGLENDDPPPSTYAGFLKSLTGSYQSDGSGD